MYIGLFVVSLFIILLIIGISMILFGHINYKKGKITKSTKKKYDFIGGILIMIVLLMIIAYTFTRFMK
jgi:hypothetical protein